MATFERWKTLGIIAVRLVIGVPTTLLVLATPSLADTVADFHATFVEGIEFANGRTVFGHFEADVP